MPITVPQGGPRAAQPPCAAWPGGAGRGRADWFAGDVANLEQVAKGMRAAALERNQTRLARARQRAAHRQDPPGAGLRIAFRLPAPRVESAEGRRRRVRDLVLLADGDPASWPNAELALAHLPALTGQRVRLLEPDRCEELDGIGARAARYRAELARGDWQLAPSPTDPHEPPDYQPKGRTQ